MAENNKIFQTLNEINVNDHTEKKKGSNNRELTYLSWAWAWAETKKSYPDAKYTIERFGENKAPYYFDENLGYMVFTTVTIGNLTHEMWLPVMDSQNRAMTNYSYEVKTKNRTIYVSPAKMTDINKAIMRCLTKNLAMFGLGLYIYAGEDIPEPEQEEIENNAFNNARGSALAKINEIASKTNSNSDDLFKWVIDATNEITGKQDTDITKENIGVAVENIRRMEDKANKGA